MSDGKTTTSNRSRGAVVSGAGNVDETTVAGACYTGEAVQDHEIPNTGKGGSSGPRAYNYFKNKHYPKTLTFDEQKRPS